jgi:hypothetical protein
LRADRLNGPWLAGHLPGDCGGSSAHFTGGQLTLH